MQQPLPDKRKCACGRGHTFQPHNARHLYANEACKSWSRRNRKNERALTADKQTWYKNLSNKSAMAYYALCLVSGDAPMTMWSLYRTQGIEFVESTLTLIGYALASLLGGYVEYGSKELVEVARVYWPENQTKGN